MGEHDRLRPRRQGRFEQRNIDIRGPGLDIDKDRNGAVLHDRGDRGRESGRDGDDFVAAFDPPLSEQRRGQRHKGQQIRRGTRIHEKRPPDAEVCRQLLFEFPRIAPGGQPEFECRVNEVHEFLFVVNPPGIVDPALSRDERRLLLSPQSRQRLDPA